MSKTGGSHYSGYSFQFDLSKTLEIWDISYHSFYCKLFDIIPFIEKLGIKMKSKNTCIICGKRIGRGAEMCYSCEEVNCEQSDPIDYSPNQTFTPSSLFGSRLFTFFQEFYAREEVLAAYAADHACE